MRCGKRPHAKGDSSCLTFTPNRSCTLAGLTHKSAPHRLGRVLLPGRRTTARRQAGRRRATSKHVHPPRRESIGARSEPYGPARVEVCDAAATWSPPPRPQPRTTAGSTGLEPDTEYTYRVFVNGRGVGARASAATGSATTTQGARAERATATTTASARTPTRRSPRRAADLRRHRRLRHRRQERRRRPPPAARSRTRSSRRSIEHGVRLILTTGDNIYARQKLLGIPSAATGDEDDDWFFTFLPALPLHHQPHSRLSRHRQPRRRRDRGQRRPRPGRWTTSTSPSASPARRRPGAPRSSPGLFYRFRYGSEIEFVCIDTSKEPLLRGDRFFRTRTTCSSSKRCLARRRRPRPRWRIPFAHHPPFCAGPQHHNTSGMEQLVPQFERAGVRVVFSGHEHNFQHSRVGRHRLLRDRRRRESSRRTAEKFEEAHTVSWAAACHFLLVTIDGNADDRPAHRRTRSGRRALRNPPAGPGQESDERADSHQP